MKNKISLDEHLQLIADKITKICIGNPSNSYAEFNFPKEKFEYPVKEQYITTIL